MKRAASLVLALITAFTFTFPALAQNQEENISLAEIYKNNFLIGSVFSPWQVTGDMFEIMKKDYNALTAENAMKPDAMQKSKGNFNFTDVDKAVDAILSAGIMVHGHTLAWHSQSPAFLNKGVTREEAEQNLAGHINGVAGHYAGKLISWDVLNEAMNDGPSNPEDWRAALRKSDWYNAFAQDGNGEDYIYEAFKLAREADPDAVLYYNDYNLNNRNKARAVYYMVKELNERYLAEGNERLLIEGVGMQGHYSINTTISSVEESIKLFSELGVEISISELDVTVPGASDAGLDSEDELRQAVMYAQLFSLFKKYSDVIARVTFWGLNDGMSWRSGQYPLLYNRDFSPKLAYFAVADPEGFLAENSIPEAEVVKRLTGSAVYGTPAIDGEIDDIWLTAEVLPVDQMLQAWQTASGTVRVLWDKEFLYVLAEVNDTVLDKSSFNEYEQDSVEIFVDEENCKKIDFMSDDAHYRVRYDAYVSFGTGGNSIGFSAAASGNGASYIIEMAIPFKVITPQEGMTIGFDAQINDGKNGTRAGIAKWNDPTNESYINTSGWGELKLTGGGSSENAPQSENIQQLSGEQTPSDESADEPSAEAVSSGTEARLVSVLPILITVIVLISGIAAAVIFIVMKKRNSSK